LWAASLTLYNNLCTLENIDAFFFSIAGRKKEDGEREKNIRNFQEKIDDVLS
jgi:hypothetical protein